MSKIEFQNVIARLIEYYNTAKKSGVNDPCYYAVNKTAAWLHHKNKSDLNKHNKCYEEQWDADDGLFESTF